MKKFIYLLLITVFVFTSCNQDDEIIDLSSQNKANVEKENLKVDICHYDEDTGEYHTINVSENAVEAHLAHGDILGDCNDNLICHWVDPVANIWQPMLVKDEDLQEHLDHGDFLGSCGTNPGENFTYIPDANFEQALIDLIIDSDGIINKRVLTTDISGLGGLNVKSKNISDLTGIEDFISLRVLNFSYNQLTNVDVSVNTLLTLLRFNGNQISSINLSNNTSLRELYCYDNSLKNLDVSNNTSLRNLYCWNNGLLSLNIKNNNNDKINRFYAFSNPDLEYITVDNPINANLGIAPYTIDKWKRDSNSTYN